jgi:hypothetical protein
MDKIWPSPVSSLPRINNFEPQAKHTSFSYWISKTSVANPAFQLNSDPDPGFWWPNIEEKKYNWKKIYFLIKNCSLSLGLYKGRPSYRISLQTTKENIKDFKKWNLLTFYIFVGHFALLDLNRDCESRSRTPLNPDPQHCRYVLGKRFGQVFLIGLAAEFSRQFYKKYHLYVITDESGSF